MRKLIAAVAAIACLVPVAAFAAKPAKDSSFQWCPSKDKCPLGFETNKEGTKIINLRMYDMCSELPATYPAVKVRAKGKFAKSGKVKDVLGKEIAYSIQGQFKKPGKAVGTYELDAKGCKDSAQKFVAKRVSSAQG